MNDYATAARAENMIDNLNAVFFWLMEYREYREEFEAEDYELADLDNLITYVQEPRDYFLHLLDEQSSSDPVEHNSTAVEGEDNE